MLLLLLCSVDEGGILSGGRTPHLYPHFVCHIMRLLIWHELHCGKKHKDVAVFLWLMQVCARRDVDVQERALHLCIICEQTSCMINAEYV